MKLKKKEHHYLNGTLHYRYFGSDNESERWLGYEEWIYPKYNQHDRCYYSYSELVGVEIDDNRMYYNI